MTGQNKPVADSLTFSDQVANVAAQAAGTAATPIRRYAVPAGTDAQTWLAGAATEGTRATTQVTYLNARQTLADVLGRWPEFQAPELGSSAARRFQPRTSHQSFNNTRTQVPLTRAYERYANPFWGLLTGFGDVFTFGDGLGEWALTWGVPTG